MADDLLTPSDPNYISFLRDVKAQVQATRIQVARSMNKHLIQFYWWLGEEIVKRQKRFGWGKSVVEQLSKDLRETFPNTKGFSVQNLWHTRQFFNTYKDFPNLQQAVGEIAWSHNLLIMSKLKENAAREFYLREAAKWGWSRNVLAFQIDADLYHRQNLAVKQNNFEQTLPAILAEQAHESMKSTYMLDMLGLSHPVQEAVIEDRMVRIIQRVMLELGQGFSFIGNQYPIRANETDYFIDLLFSGLTINDARRGKNE